MFHYAFLVAWERFSTVVIVAICCKLFQMLADRSNCCRLFTNCCNLLQNDKNTKLSVPRPPRRFLYKVKEEEQGTSMDTIPQPRRRGSRSDLAHLRSLPSVEPATSTGKVIAVWK